LISSLLLLHGLHPQDLEERVAAALERVRPDLHAHGGDVELLSIDDGVVRLRMQGNCDGCPSSAATLKFTIEQAIYAAAPDVAAIEVEGIESPPPGLVQLELSAGTR
jgi:Fe-S cluster biogenesis protein NfuA